MDYLRKNIDFIDGFLNHLDTAAATDFFVRLITINTLDPTLETVSWLIEVGFVEEIFKRLEKDYSYMHHDVAQAIVDILNTATWDSQISDQMMTDDSFSFLMEVMMDPDNPTGFTYGSKVVNKIIRNIVQINDDPNTVSFSFFFWSFVNKNNTFKVFFFSFFPVGFQTPKNSI